MPLAPLLRLDRRGARRAARLASCTPAFHPLARGYSRSVFPHFGGWLALGWLRAWRTRDPARLRAMVTVSTGTTVAFALAQALSVAVPRRRPFVDDGAPLLAHRADSSFPSDHATVAAAIAAGLWAVDRPLGAGAAAAAALLAADRVYLGVHYPTDVVAGAVLGAVAAAGTVRATTRPGPG